MYVIRISYNGKTNEISRDTLEEARSSWETVIEVCAPLNAKVEVFKRVDFLKEAEKPGNGLTPEGEVTPHPPTMTEIRELISSYGEEGASTSEVARRLMWDSKTVLKLITKLVQGGSLMKIGVRNQTKYVVI